MASMQLALQCVQTQTHAMSADWRSPAVDDALRLGGHLQRRLDSTCRKQQAVGSASHGQQADRSVMPKPGALAALMSSLQHLLAEHHMCVSTWCSIGHEASSDETLTTAIVPAADDCLNLCITCSKRRHVSGLAHPANNVRSACHCVQLPGARQVGPSSSLKEWCNSMKLAHTKHTG